MIKAPIDLQDLRRRLYVKAKADRSDGAALLATVLQRLLTPLFSAVFSVPGFDFISSIISSQQAN
jgi:hypothetical protein